MTTTALTTTLTTTTLKRPYVDLEEENDDDSIPAQSVKRTKTVAKPVDVICSSLTKNLGVARFVLRFNNLTHYDRCRVDGFACERYHIAKAFSQTRGVEVDSCSLGRIVSFIAPQHFNEDIPVIKV